MRVRFPSDGYQAPPFCFASIFRSLLLSYCSTYVYASLTTSGLISVAETLIRVWYVLVFEKFRQAIAVFLFVRELSFDLNLLI